MRYVQRLDGEGFSVVPGEVARWSCCDCGLVHDIAFAIEGGLVGVAAQRNARATAAKRRGRANADTTDRQDRTREEPLIARDIAGSDTAERSDRTREAK